MGGKKKLVLFTKAWKDPIGIGDGWAKTAKMPRSRVLCNQEGTDQAGQVGAGRINLPPHNTSFLKQMRGLADRHRIASDDKRAVCAPNP